MLQMRRTLSETLDYHACFSLEECHLPLGVATGCLLMYSYTSAEPTMIPLSGTSESLSPSEDENRPFPLFRTTKFRLVARLHQD